MAGLAGELSSARLIWLNEPERTGGCQSAIFGALASDGTTWGYRRMPIRLSFSALWQAPVQNAYLYRIPFPFVQAILEVIYSLKSGSPKLILPFSLLIICSEISFCIARCELDMAPSLCLVWNSWEKGLL